ncbi:MAG TPA: type II toxin-antitoxin system VapC family toxin [Nakamurella sp.]|nr:type II toxin-antitoxin system VapC family toxin [Nakamurella sp.]
MSERVGTLVDSSVLLDVSTQDLVWFDWSSAALAEAVRTGPVFLNPVVYAEVSVGYDRIEDLDDALPAEIFRRAAVPYVAAFLAGKAYRDYRRRGGARTSPLPDFFIGAHAAVSSFTLLTRDAGRYRMFFPTVQLIAP